MFKATVNPYDEVVAKATDENQTSEDWGILATVWDKVNDDGATGSRNCIAAIQKRLQHRNANVQLYALTLSDALVNNCGINLHREISSRAFTQTLSRIVQDRTTHDKVRRRIMQLLKSWTETFKKDETLGIVEETYEQLKKSHRAEESSSAPVPDTRASHQLMKQEEEDMQRAIAESEALARQQNTRQGYVPSAAPATNYASAPSGPFFTSADGKALPEVQPQASTSAQQPYERTASNQPPSAPSRVRALYDFEPQEEGELAFRRGDVIRVVNSAYEGWWKGELDGRVGIFPLTYIEIIPDPTPESVLRDAEIESQVFAQAGSVDRLLSMLSAADAQGSNISEDDELMDLYQQCILLRPKIVNLLSKYNQKQKDLSSLHEKWKVAKTAYDSMLDESEQKRQAQSTSRFAGYGAQQPPYQPQVVPQQQTFPQQQLHPVGREQSYYPGQHLPPQQHLPQPGSGGPIHENGPHVQQPALRHSSNSYAGSGGPQGPGIPPTAQSQAVVPPLHQLQHQPPFSYGSGPGPNAGPGPAYHGAHQPQGMQQQQFQHAPTTNGYA